MNHGDLNDERGLEEIARVLARGILRLRALTASERSDGKELLESDQKGLEVSDKTVLTVHSGKRSPRLSEGVDYVD